MSIVKEKMMSSVVCAWCGFARKVGSDRKVSKLTGKSLEKCVCGHTKEVHEFGVSWCRQCSVTQPTSLRCLLFRRKGVNPGEGWGNLAIPIPQQADRVLGRLVMISKDGEGLFVQRSVTGLRTRQAR